MKEAAFACNRRRREQFISQGNALPRVPCYARRYVSSRARDRTSDPPPKKKQGPTDIEDNSSAKAMLDRAFDAMLEVVSDPEPET